MTPEQKAAFIISQSVCMAAELLGMYALNVDRDRNNLALAYTEDAFANIANKYGLEHNQVISFLA